MNLRCICVFVCLCWLLLFKVVVCFVVLGGGCFVGFGCLCVGVFLFVWV